MASYTVRTQQGPQTFQSNLTLEQAAQIVIANIEGTTHVVLWKESTRTFAMDLVRAYRQFGMRLTPARQAWLIKVAQEVVDAANQQVQTQLAQIQAAVGANQPPILPVQAVPAPFQPTLPLPVKLPTPPTRPQIGNFADIVAIFQTASQHLKFPRIILQTAKGQNVALQVATINSKFPGSIHVSDGIRRVAGGKYFGRIDRDGSFDTQYPNADVIDLLKRFAADPATVAAEYGKLTGACCFCKMPLTDPRSTEVGYGPICASHYSLPWGDRSAKYSAMGTNETGADHGIGTEGPHGQATEQAPHDRPDTGPSGLRARQLSVGDQEGTKSEHENQPLAGDQRRAASAHELVTPIQDEYSNLLHTPQDWSQPGSDQTSRHQISSKELEPSSPAVPSILQDTPADPKDYLPGLQPVAAPEAAGLYQGASYYKCTYGGCAMHNKFFQAMTGAEVKCPKCGQPATLVDPSVFTIQVPAEQAEEVVQRPKLATPMKPNFPLGVAPHTGKSVLSKAAAKVTTTAGTPKQAPKPTTEIFTTEVRGTTVSFQLMDYPNVRFCSSNNEWDEEYKRTTGSCMENRNPHEFIQFIRWIYNHQ